MLLPALASAKDRAKTSQCMNNLRQWGLAFKMYGDDNDDNVAEEGDTAVSIADATASNNRTAAWYNSVPTFINQPTLVTMYQTHAPPLPGDSTIFSCPSCAQPNQPQPGGPSGVGFTGTPYATPVPTFTKAFFMYAENSRACVNWGTRYTGTFANPIPTGIAQTKFATAKRPSDTIILAEQDPTTASDVSESVTTGKYAVARHSRSKVGVFTMFDGSSHTYRLDQVIRDSASANDAQTEWGVDREVYWYPSPNTPN